MKAFVRIMKALSDPSRVRVLKLLEEKELCVCEIQQALGLAQSTISRHMKILEDAELVNRSRQGTWIIYTLADGNDSVYAKTLLVQLNHWLDDDSTLIAMKKSLPDIKRKRQCGLKRNN